MERPQIKGKRPEEALQEKIIAYLQARRWYVNPTHGNMFQRGFPDLFCCHHQFGVRWVEVKVAERYSFTPAQLREFPLMCANGSGVWIMCDATDSEYAKLFKPCNWWVYLATLNQKPAHDLLTPGKF